MKMHDNNTLRIILIIIPIFLCFILLFLLFYDEKLIPEAEEWMKQVEFVEENPLDNEYYFLIGFNCPEHLDPSEVGYKWIQKQNEQVMTKIKSNDYSQNRDLFLIDENDSLQVDLEKLFSFYTPYDSLTVKQFLNEKGRAIDSIYTAFNFMFERFDRISKFPYFQNTQLPHFASDSPLLRQIYLINQYKNYWVTKQYIVGSKSIAIEELEESIRKSRYLMEHAQSEFMRLLSIYMLKDCLKCISFIIDSEDNSELIAIELKPITRKEHTCETLSKNTFKSNISMNQMLYSILKENYCSKNFFQNLFNSLVVKWKFKYNKSINNSYKNYKLIKDASELSAIEFVDFTELWDFEETPSLQYFFDPVGATVNGFALPIYRQNLVYPYNLNGYINMLKLKMMIKQQNILSKDIPEFLKAQSDSLFNPYTEEAIKWDSANSKLYYEGPFEDNDDMREIEIK